MKGWRWYKRMLENNPMVTKAITAGILMGSSDVLSQSFEQTREGFKKERRIPEHQQQGDQGSPLLVAFPLVSMPTVEEFVGRYDWNRSMQVAITGLTFTGPLTHTWYNILERIVAHSIPRIPILAVGAVPQLAYKMFLDAVLYSPVAVGGYFVWRTQLEGGSGSTTWEKLRVAYPEALVASWSFWPAANVINFTMIPLPFRVLYNNMLSLFWNAYLSTVNSKSSVSLEPAEESLGLPTVEL